MSEKRRRQVRGSGDDVVSTDRSKKHRQHKLKLMDQSNQTDEERRHLRREQRDLQSKVLEQQADIADPTKNNMHDLTRENQELFNRTRFPREAVQDGEILKIITKHAANQIAKVPNAVGVDLETFLTKVHSVFGAAGELNWAKLGGNFSMVFLSAPQGGGFMMGPLDKPAKGPRAQGNRTRRPVDDDAEDVRPETLKVEKGKKGAKQNKDQTQMRIAKMRKQEKPEEGVGPKKDMFEALINPRSFTQTVENLFDFSFFVKSTEGEISIDEETKLPQVSFNNSTATGDTDGHTKQWLMSITPGDFRELKHLYDLEESNIEHRDEGPKSDYFDPLVHGSRACNDQ